MNDEPAADLPVLKANLRWRRAIYAWITAGGAVLCGGLALYLQNGGELEGPAIAFAVVCGGMLLIGAALLVPSLKVDGASVVRVLTERPGDVLRVGLKRTESNIAGVDAASYEWIVVEVGTPDRLDDRFEVLVKQRDLGAVLAEIRTRAPDAEFDRRVNVERTNVRF